MKKNAASQKTPQGSFEEEGNEPFNERLKRLMRGRSVRQCAIDWGINISTLKNYFSRPDAKPRFNVLSKISTSEDVSIEWLLGDEVSSNTRGVHKSQNEPTKRVWHKRLYDMLELLEDDDLEALTKQLTLKGLETILYLLDDDNIELIRMDPIVKEKILGKQSTTAQDAALAAQEKRERDTDNEHQTTANSLTTKRAV